MDWQALYSPTITRRESVDLGCEIEGMQIYVQRPHFRDGFDELGMSYRGRSGKVYCLRDLRGLVRITNGEMALRFVRLRTGHLLSDPDICEYEVFTQAEYTALPDWNRAWLTNPWLGEDLTSRTVLEPQTFQQAGFEAARVDPVEGGFRITRWTYTPQLSHRRRGNTDEMSRATYQKIAETVTTDGGYIRSALEQRIAPDNEHLRPAEGPGETKPDELLRPSA